nr:hypothetical protein Iba_chr02dCG4560 [Ipomoea batatas]
MFSPATTICEARAAAVRFSLGFETGGEDFNSRVKGILPDGQRKKGIRLCEIETDKATLEFESLEEGFNSAVDECAKYALYGARSDV